MRPSTRLACATPSSFLIHKQPHTSPHTARHTQHPAGTRPLVAARKPSARRDRQTTARTRAEPGVPSTPAGLVAQEELDDPDYYDGEGGGGEIESAGVVY